MEVLIFILLIVCLAESITSIHLMHQHDRLVEKLFDSDHGYIPILLKDDKTTLHILKELNDLSAKQSDLIFETLHILVNNKLVTNQDLDNIRNLLRDKDNVND